MRVLTEDEVIDAVIAFLETDRWSILSRATAKQHGDDVVAVREGERLIIEAKGAGSSKPGTKRYGQEFTKGQVFDHVGKAILKALRVVSSREGGAAVAFPDNENHRTEVAKVENALKRLGIKVFWVSTDGKVKTAGADMATTHGP